MDRCDVGDASRCCASSAHAHTHPHAPARATAGRDGGGRAAGPAPPGPPRAQRQRSAGDGAAHGRGPRAAPYRRHDGPQEHTVHQWEAHEGAPMSVRPVVAPTTTRSRGAAAVGVAALVVMAAPLGGCWALHAARRAVCCRPPWSPAPSSTARASAASLMANRAELRATTARYGRQRRPRISSSMAWRPRCVPRTQVRHLISVQPIRIVGSAGPSAGAFFNPSSGELIYYDSTDADGAEKRAPARS